MVSCHDTRAYQIRNISRKQKMFNFLRQCKRLFYFISVVDKNQRLISPTKCFASSFNYAYASQIRLFVSIQKPNFLLSNDQSRFILRRNKSHKKKTGYKGEAIDSCESSDDEDDFVDEDEDEDNTIFGKNSDIKTYNFRNLRFDLILKSALGISRKKIEEAFYQNKIRINGNKVLKKSLNVQVDDEIDIIKGFDNSENKLKIWRIKILKIKPNLETRSILVKVLKMKSLQIDNYQHGEAFKEPKEE